MTNPSFDLITEYNSKALETLKVFGDLNVANANAFINKQVELSNALLDAGLASGKEFAAVKTPAEVVEVSNKLVQSVTATLSGFVQDSTAESLKARDSLKAVLDDSLALNNEYADKAVKTGVETAKKAAKKAA